MSGCLVYVQRLTGVFKYTMNQNRRVGLIARTGDISRPTMQQAERLCWSVNGICFPTTLAGCVRREQIKELNEARRSFDLR